MSFSKSHKWINAQSDIWETGAAPEGEFVLLPVGLPPLVTTSQTILLAGNPEGYKTAGQIWSPAPIAGAAFGTLTAGEDFFPFYRNGVFWYTRQIKSMVLNGIEFDSANPDHAFAMTRVPSASTFGFYKIDLNSGPPFSIFAAIRNLVAGQTLTITDIVLATT
jgi:hypothetical protein